MMEVQGCLPSTSCGKPTGASAGYRVREEEEGHGKGFGVHLGGAMWPDSQDGDCKKSMWGFGLGYGEGSDGRSCHTFAEWRSLSVFFILSVSISPPRKLQIRLGGLDLAQQP